MEKIMPITKGPQCAILFIACGALALLSRPAAAHHGRDFLLLETDDMPAKGQSYAVLSVDTLRNSEGDRSTEITPGVVLRAGSRIAVEPHFHIEREPGEDFKYAAAAVGVRYRIGDLGHTGWRGALSAETEITRNRANEPSNGTFRFAAARTLPNALVAANLIIDHEFTADGAWDYALGAGVLTPLPNGDQVGIEGIVALPLHDGVEILPSYSRRITKNTQVKLGVGWFHATDVNSGTLHMQLVQRF